MKKTTNAGGFKSPTQKLVALLALVALLMGGCGRLKPVNLIDENVQVPDKKAIIFFVDGINRGGFRQMLAAGQLPQIDKYLIQRGTRVKNAVTAFPSITYAITTSFATGQVPGRHGVLGNRFFDRDQLFYVNYGTTKTYRDVDDHYRYENIYEILNDQFSVSIQTPVRRGVYRKIDNWATSGIRWYFGQITEIDCLTAERFNLIGDISQQAGEWPSLIFAYFPATDEMGHRYGPDSERYRKSLLNVDEQIGRICDALQASGILESTYLLLISDHGMAACGRDNYLKLSELIENTTGLKLTTEGPDLRTPYHERVEYFSQYEAVLANGGNRLGKLYLRGKTGWSSPPRPQQLREIADLVTSQPAVALAAYRDGQVVVVQNAISRALIDRLDNVPGKNLSNRQYRYRVIDSQCPLGYPSNSRASRLLDEKFHSGKDWLWATAESEYPDLPVQIIEMFDSDRAGNLVIFAADGWDFSPANIGGHGSVRATDMMVPMVFAGPGITPGGQIETARTVDVAPTIIEMIDQKKLEGRNFDGKSLLSELENKGNR
ncbi:MAG: alkaline phosphatase family protein [Sedimentisphaerales bacterium]|nr:alkaline phosphatase family protein [Sedimentisphaerales bacterium]